MPLHLYKSKLKTGFDFISLTIIGLNSVSSKESKSLTDPSLDPIAMKFSIAAHEYGTP